MKVKRYFELISSRYNSIEKNCSDGKNLSGSYLIHPWFTRLEARSEINREQEIQQSHELLQRLVMILINIRSNDPLRLPNTAETLCLE